MKRHRKQKQDMGSASFYHPRFALSHHVQATSTPRRSAKDLQPTEQSNLLEYTVLHPSFFTLAHIPVPPHLSISTNFAEDNIWTSCVLRDSVPTLEAHKVRTNIENNQRLYKCDSRCKLSLYFSALSTSIRRPKATTSPATNWGQASTRLRGDARNGLGAGTDCWNPAESS